MRVRTRLRADSAFVVAVALFLSACGSARHQVASPSRPLPQLATNAAVILAINDVYRIEGVEGGEQGGIARVRALRKALEANGDEVIVVHAGDLLFPSFASRMYSGAQMIDALNALDGSNAAGTFDPRLFITFGNHEFEKPKAKDVGILASRVAESQFSWLGGNIDFARDAGKSLIPMENVHATRVVESGGLKIGLFGITIPTLGVEYASFDGPNATAKRLTAELRQQGVDLVVAVTHLNAADDRDLLAELGDDGPDLVIGGHDHEKMASEVNGRWVVKADADARSATVFRIEKQGDGKPKISWTQPTLRANDPAPDSDLAVLVDRWQLRHATEFCAKSSEPPTCLTTVYGRTQTALEAEENKIRGRETSLGNWIADLMVEPFRACGARVAFLNAGTLRLNQDLAAGSEITRRNVEELFGFPCPLRLVRLTGKDLRGIAAHSVRGWPGSGTWLQISGWAFVHNTESASAEDVTLLSSLDGVHEPGDDEQILAVVGDYLVNPEIGDQDGYGAILTPDKIVTNCAASGIDLKVLAAQAIQAAEPAGIAPRFEGRICVKGAPEDAPCLAD